MTKSELIERLCAEQTHLSAKEIEDAVKNILEHMASTLEAGSASRFVVSVAFPYTIVSRVLGVILRLAIRLSWKVSTFRISNQARNYANALTCNLSKVCSHERHANPACRFFISA